MKKFYVYILWIPFISFGQVQIGDDIIGGLQSEQFGRSVSLSADGNILAVGGNANNGIANTVGVVRIYENVNGIWTQIGDDIFGNTFDFIGEAVKLSSNGNILAIGGEDASSTGTGFVRIYENVNGVWTQIGNDILGIANGDDFGSSLSLSSDGNVVALGAEGHNNFTGYVRIFENIGGTWTQLGNDFNGSNSFERLGRSVSLSSTGNILAIGISGESSNGISSGQVRVYEFTGGSWTQIGQNINGSQIGDFLGTTVRLNDSGTILAVSSFFDENGGSSGQVKVYEFNNNNWIQIGDVIDGENDGDGSGKSLDISADGSVVAIGTDVNNSFAGHVRIYKNQAGVWTQVGQDIDGNNSSDQFGISLALSSSGEIVASGAFTANTTNGIGSGYAAVYDLSAELSTNEQMITDFTIFPNPARNQFTIQLENPSDLQNINIYNQLGQLVLNSKELIVDISKLVSGLYLVEVVTAIGKDTKKLIIR